MARVTTPAFVTVQQSRRRLTGIVAACVSVLLVGYLLTCGDVESNPGPGTGQEAGYNGRVQEKEANRGVHTHPAQPSRFSQQPLDSFHAEISHILNQAVARMESTTRQQGHNIERRLQSVEEKNRPSVTRSGSEPSTAQQQCRWTVLTVPGALVGEPEPQGHRQLSHQQVRLQRQSEQT